MDRLRVTSSTLASAGYDPDSQILEIEFIKDGIYQYHNVPEEIYRGLLAAVSHGSYFDFYVKKAGYHCIKIS